MFDRRNKMNTFRVLSERTKFLYAIVMSAMLVWNLGCTRHEQYSREVPKERAALKELLTRIYSEVIKDRHHLDSLESLTAVSSKCGLQKVQALPRVTAVHLNPRLQTWRSSWLSDSENLGDTVAIFCERSDGLFLEITFDFSLYDRKEKPAFHE